MKEIVFCLFLFSGVPEEIELYDISFNEIEFELSEMADLSIVKSDNSIEVDVDVSLYE